MSIFHRWGDELMARATLGRVYVGAADTGESLATIDRIEDGDIESMGEGMGGDGGPPRRDRGGVPPGRPSRRAPATRSSALRPTTPR